MCLILSCQTVFVKRKGASNNGGSRQNKRPDAEENEENTCCRTDVPGRDERMEPAGHKDPDQRGEAEGGKTAEEHGEETLIFHGQEQRRDLRLVPHLRDGDQAEGGDEPCPRRGFDLFRGFSLGLAQQHIQAKEDEHPGRDARDQRRRKQLSQTPPHERGAARQEREGKERPGKDRPSSVTKRQGKDHELRLVAEFRGEDEAEGDKEDRHKGQEGLNFFGADSLV